MTWYDSVEMLDDVPAGSCIDISTGPTDSLVNQTLDVGTAVTVRSAARSFVARGAGGYDNSIPGFVTTTNLNGAGSYDVSFPGKGTVLPTSWLGALRVPQRLFFQSPPVGSSGNLTLPWGSDVTFRWTPTGSDALVFVLGKTLCHFDDTGTAQVPAAVFVTATNAFPYSWLYAVDRDTRMLNGREVHLLGASAWQVSYTFH